MQITIIGCEEVPFQKVFGIEVGQRILEFYKSNGITMVMNSEVVSIKGNKSKFVTKVVLENDTSLPCDLLIVGTGTRLNTDFLHCSGLKINSNGSIDVDKYMMTNVENIYAGGDIAYAHILTKGNQKDVIQHYQIAQYHGRIAAKNMSGNRLRTQTVPFFFTKILGKSFRYAGHGTHSKVYIHGSLIDLEFVAYYLDDKDHVIGVLTCERDPVASQFAELLTQSKNLHVSEIKNSDDPMGWTKKLYEKPLNSFEGNF